MDHSALSCLEVKNAHSFSSMVRGVGKRTCLHVGNKETNTQHFMIHIKSVCIYVAKLNLSAFV